MSSITTEHHQPPHLLNAFSSHYDMLLTGGDVVWLQRCKNWSDHDAQSWFCFDIMLRFDCKNKHKITPHVMWKAFNKRGKNHGGKHTALNLSHGLGFCYNFSWTSKIKGRLQKTRPNLFRHGWDWIWLWFRPAHPMHESTDVITFSLNSFLCCQMSMWFITYNCI